MPALGRALRAPCFATLLVVATLLGGAGPVRAAGGSHPIDRAWLGFAATADSLGKGSNPRGPAYVDSIRKVAVARGDRALEAATQLWLGDRRATYEYEFAPGDSILTLALTAARAMRDSFAVVRTLSRLGYSAQLAGRIDDATARFNETVRLARRTHQVELEGFAHRALGSIAKNDGEYAKARRELTLAMAQLRPETFEHLHSKFLYGEVLNRTGQRDEAHQVFDQVLAEAQKRKNRWLIAAALNDLGIVAFEQGDMAAADRNWEVAAAHFDTLAMRNSDRGSALNARINRAHALIQLGRLDEAEALLDRLAELSTQFEDPELGVAVQGEIGVLQRRAGRTAQAERTLRGVRAAAAANDAQGEEAATIELAGLLRETGRPAAAEKLIDSLLVPARRVRMTKDNAGAALMEKSAARRAQGRHSEALDPAREADRLTRGATKTTSIYALDSAVELARVHRAMGRPDSAIVVLRRAARDWERWRAEISDLEWRERAGSGLSGMFAELGLACLDPRRGVPEARRAQQAFDALQTFQARTLEERMQGLGLAARAMTRRVTADSLRRAVLRPDEALLDLVATPETTFAFVVTRGAVVARLLPGTRRLDPLFADWRGGMLGGAAAGVADAGLARLSAELLAPVADALRPARRIVVTGGGPLAMWPFAALTLPGEGVPLDATREVTAAPSATLLTLLRGRATRAPGAGDLLALSRTTDAAGRDLPGAEREIADLGRGYTRVVVRRNRGERTVPELIVDLPRFDALHFAAHAEAEAGSPWRSGFLLGRGTEDDAYLRASTVARMKLKARLAVLSGCQSAGATTLAGEGALGLTSGFLCAGTTTVIATLWPVEDRTAEQYMVAFYGALADGQDAAAAARTARAFLRARPATAHVRDWGAFVLVGEPGTRLRLVPRRAS